MYHKAAICKIKSMNFMYRGFILWYYKRVCGRIWQQAMFLKYKRKDEGEALRRVNWILILLILIGFVIGGFIGTYFDGTFLNYGQSFGLSSPIELDMGFIVLTFGLKFYITIASVIGVVVALTVYKFIR